MGACGAPNPAWQSSGPGWPSAVQEESPRAGENQTYPVVAENGLDGVEDGRSNAASAAPAGWVCVANGESVYGYDVESGPPGDVQGTSSVHITGHAQERADAEDSALSNCNSLMTVDLTRNRAMNAEPSSQGSWGAAVSSRCHISECEGSDAGP